MKIFTSIILIIALAIQAFGQTITVGSTSYQTMKGWQVSGDTGVLEYPNASVNWHDAALDDNVALGINYPRIGLHSGAAENSTDYYGAFLANGEDKGTGSGTTLFSAVTSNWYVPVNDNADPNSINASGFKWSLLDAQMDNIIVPMKAKLAARGEDMFWMVTYIHFSTSNQLHVNTPAEYGELILATWQHLEATYGYVPPALEIYLEPDGGNSQVTESELSAMVVAARDRLVGAGYAKPYMVAPSTVDGGNAEPYYDAMALTARGYIDEISYHRYVVPTNGEIAALRSQAEADSKNTGMTEYGQATMFDLYEDLTTGKVSSWEQYALAYPFEGDTGYHHITVGNSPTYTRTVSERTKYLQHFYKYIRRGAVMKSVTNSGGTFVGVPFVNANGTYVVVVVAYGSGTVTVSGLPSATYGRIRTQGDGTSAPSSYNTDLGNTTGTSASVTFTAAGIATVYNVNYAGAICKYFFATIPSGCG